MRLLNMDCNTACATNGLVHNDSMQTALAGADNCWGRSNAGAAAMLGPQQSLIQILASMLHFHLGSNFVTA